MFSIDIKLICSCDLQQSEVNLSIKSEILDLKRILLRYQAFLLQYKTFFLDMKRILQLYETLSATKRIFLSEVILYCDINQL